MGRVWCTELFSSTVLTIEMLGVKLMQKLRPCIICDKLPFQNLSVSVCLHNTGLTVFNSVLYLTIFSSCPGGFLRKMQRGAKKISTIPMMVISQGKPMLSAMDPPMDGPVTRNN